MTLAFTSRIGLGAVLVLLTGCFTEPKTEGPSTTGSSCDPGSFGCECLDGVCEPDLACTPSGVCIPEDCTPGTAVCQCDAQGRCGPGLECSSDVCLPSGGTSAGTSDTSGASTTTTGSTATSTADTTGPDDTSTTVSADESTTLDPDSTGPSDTTDMPMSCGAQDIGCGACFSCTDDLDCAPEFAACQGIENCVVAAACIESCAVEGFCFDDCCAGEPAALREAAEALHSCRANTCILGPCESYANIPAGFCGS